MEILATAGTWAVSLLAVLGRASVHGAVAIAAVWLLCRLVPRLPATLRCGLWWLACLKLLVALVWVEPVSLALLPVEAQVAPPPMVVGQGSLAGTVGVGAKDPKDFKDIGNSKPLEPLPSLRSLVSWPLAFAGLWLAGLFLQLTLTGRQLAQSRRIVRSAEPVTEPRIVALFRELRERLGVRRAKLLASPEVETPQVSGTWRPRVLLPRRALVGLSAQELALTLGHELLHVRRGDLWLGWIPALAQRVFFFHPLVALAAREYAVAREAACDAAVLRFLDPAPEAYGRLLLRLGVAPRVPRWAAAGAAPTFQTLKRRLEMLQQSADKKRMHRGWWGLLALLALAVLIPIQIVAQTPPEPPEAPEAPAAIEAPEAPEASAPPEAPAAPEAPEAPEAVDAELPALPALSAITPVPPAPPAPPVPAVLPVAQLAQGRIPPAPPAAPAAPPAPPVPSARGGARHLSFGDSGEAWVLVEDAKSVTMSGNTSDVHKAREHYSGKPILWFERNGKSYVIRDEATVARARSFFAKQRELGDQQGALGDKQGKLGEQQGKLGEEMGRYGGRIGTLASQQAARDMSGESGESFEKEIEELSQRMEALGHQMEALGGQQEALGRQQEALGRQQEQIANEGERQLRSLLDQAITNGLAKEAGK